MTDDTDNLDTESPEWGELVRRRGVLIRKKNRRGLDDGERAEYERLEKIVDAVMERKFPPRDRARADQ